LPKKGKSVMPFRGRMRMVKAPRGWRISDAQIIGDNKYVRILYLQPVKRRSKKDKR